MQAVLCAVLVAAGAAPASASEDSGKSTPAIIDPEPLAWLENLARAVADASRIEPGATAGGVGPNVSGGVLLRPGGRHSYPAFWIRDYAMSLESGLITSEEQRHALVWTATHQQDEPWSLPSGSFVPPGAIPDHISLGGKPIFYPGTLEDFEGQGGSMWGYLPCLDNQFFFVHMAAEYVRATGRAEVLQEEIRGKPLLQRLEEAYAMPPAEPETALVRTTEEARGVNFGFYDTTVHTGALLFCSLLKWRAANELAHLMSLAGDEARAGAYRAEACRVAESLEPVFDLDSGLFRAATGKSAQPDVWGTAFAVYIGALDAGRARRASEALAKLFREGAIAWRGQIRHVPTTDDFGGESMWEVSFARKNRYQNGAYWATPTGWTAYAIARSDPSAARTLVADYVAMLKETDFRRGEEYGGPWECMHPEDDHRQNPVYLTSVTAPLAALKK